VLHSASRNAANISCFCNEMLNVSKTHWHERVFEFLSWFCTRKPLVFFSSYLKICSQSETTTLLIMSIVPLSDYTKHFSFARAKLSNRNMPDVHFTFDEISKLCFTLSWKWLERQPMPCRHDFIIFVLCPKFYIIGEALKRFLFAVSSCFDHFGKAKNDLAFYLHTLTGLPM